MSDDTQISRDEWDVSMFDIDCDPDVEPDYERDEPDTRTEHDWTL